MSYRLCFDVYNCRFVVSLYVLDKDSVNNIVNNIMLFVDNVEDL